jgi:lysophospholipase L1-like esterase
MVGVAGYRQALDSMAQSAHRLHAPVVNFADYSNVMSDDESRELVAHQRSLGILHPDFRYPSGGRLRLSADDPHLNALGHHALARRMAAALRTLDVCRP